MSHQTVLELRPVPRTSSSSARQRPAQRPAQRHPRHRHRICVQTLIEGQYELQLLHTWDISLGGMFLICPHPVERGARLRLSFSLDGQACASSAIVVHTRDLIDEGTSGDPSGWGIQFVDMPSRTQELLRQFLDAHRHDIPGNDDGAEWELLPAPIFDEL